MGGGHPATFVYVVEVGLLAHGGQEVQDAGVDADFIVTAVLPGVVLDHVEKLSNKKQDPMFGMILVERQKRINNPRYEARGREKKTQKPRRQTRRSLPFAAVEELRLRRGEPTPEPGSVTQRKWTDWW